MSGNKASDVQPPSKGPYLPNFEEAMQVYNYQDSMRLPTYQFRHLGRYHPYIRYIRDKESDATKYMNTIYDDERVELVIPPVLRQLDTSRLPEMDSRILPVGRDERDDEIERRIQRLSAVMLEFLSAVKRANEIYENQCSSSPENGTDSEEPGCSTRQESSSDDA